MPELAEPACVQALLFFTGFLHWRNGRLKAACYADYNNEFGIKRMAECEESSLVSQFAVVLWEQD